MGIPSLEFQSSDDQAWYEATVDIRGFELRVHYEEYGDEFDEMISMQEFQGNISRFRLACRQLQDQHCYQVKEGLHICASCDTGEHEIKFFDAIVKQVCKSKHCLIDDEEHCTCTFKVLWQAGPNAYRITSVSCENICLLTTGNIESHPVIKEFVKAVHYNLARQEQDLSLDLNSMPVELETEKLQIPTSADITNEVSKHPEDYSVSTCGGMKRPPSSLAMDNWDEGYSCERASEQLTVKENQRDKDIMEGNVGKKVFLHYSRGNFKRRTSRSNEITGGRQVQDYSQTNANVKALKNLVQHDDLEGADKLRSSYLTASHLKHNRSHSTVGPFACSAYLQGFSDQNLGNAEEIEKVIHEYKEPVEQLLNIEVPPLKIPIEVLGISSDKSSPVFQTQSNSSNDIDARRSSGLTTSDVKAKIEDNSYDGFKDSTDHSDQTGNKVHIIKAVNKLNEVKSKKIRSPELLSVVVNISSDEENDHGAPKNKCDYKIQDLSRQHGNHVQLQRELSTVEEIKVDCPCMGDCHRNVRSGDEDRTIFRCNYEGQKTVSAIHHHCSGHSVSENSNEYKEPVDKSSPVFQMQSNSSNDIDALKSSGLTISDVKVKLQNNPYDGFKDSSDHPDKTGNKVHIVKGVNKHNTVKRKKIRSPELLSEVMITLSDEEDDHGTSKKKCNNKIQDLGMLSEVMNTLSDEEDDHGTPKKKCNNKIQDLGRQHGNHVQLQRELSTVEEIKLDCTCMCDCLRNVRSRNEDTTIFRCNYEGQKNVSAIHHHCDGHYVSKKSNYYPSVYIDATDVPSFDSDHDLGRDSHLITKEYQNRSPSSFQVYSRLSESSIRQTIFPVCDQCRKFSVNSCTAHCKYFLESSICRCNKLHTPDASALLEDESTSDGEEIGNSKDSNCKECRKSMKSILSSKRENMRIQRSLLETRYGCIGAGCGHSNEDARTEERQFYSSEFLVLDNLEKDASPFDVKDVISSMGCNVLHVYILPNLKMERFTRAFVWFQDRASLMKALGCLQDDNFFLISSNGRPWVVLYIEDGVFEGIFEGFDIESKYSKQCTSSKISVVYRGSEDFEKAKKRKNMFLEFKEKLTLLHRRLEFEEKMANES